MRAVSLVSRLEFEFKGNVSKNAICLGDADNDCDNELVIGNLRGDLVIFKGDQSAPFAEAHDLGMIMVVVIGDVLNDKLNSIVCINAEGMCYIFQINKDNIEMVEKKDLRPFHMQRLPANTKVALLADVDNDGELELVLGLTDHVLRTYRWVRLNPYSNDYKGKLVGLHKLELADQIGSISLNPSSTGFPLILISQSGGTYIDFQCCEKDKDSDGNDIICVQKDDEDTDGNASKLTTPKHHPLASSRMRNPNISSEILGGITGTRNGIKRNSLIAVATLDGTLMLVDGDETLWSLQVDHQLFALTKLDLLGDGDEEVVACAWDGLTYMVNQQKQSVRFQFDGPVTTFTCGKYSVIPGTSVNVFVYATFRNRVYIYFDIHLPCFRIHNFLETTQQNTEIASLLPQFPIKSDNSQQLRNLLQFCAYGFPLDMMNKAKGTETS